MITRDRARVDLEVRAGQLARGPARLQVKLAAYLQAWGHRKLSGITFGGGHSLRSVEKGIELGEGKFPKATVSSVRDRDRTAARGLRPPGDRPIGRAASLPAHRITQDTLSLGTHSKLAPEVAFDGVGEAIREAARQRRQKLAGAKAQPRNAEQRGDAQAIERWRVKVAYLET